MNGIVFGGDVKNVTEKLEALAYLHDGQTVVEVAEKLNRMTDEQKERYINLITLEYRQFNARVVI